MFRSKDIIKLRDGAFFAVKDEDKVNRKVLARPLYFPLDAYSGQAEGKIRKIDGRDCMRLEYQVDRKHYDQRYANIMRLRRGITIFEIPHEDIITHYSGTKRVNELFKGKPQNNVEASAKRIISYLVHEGVPLSRISITGTTLMKAAIDSSDVDLVVFGADAYKQAALAIRKLEGQNKARKWTRGELIQHYHTKHFDRETNITPDEFATYLGRELRRGFIEKTRFALFPEHDERELRVIRPYADAHYDEISRINAKGTIMVDKYSLSYPALYHVKLDAPIDGKKSFKILCFDRWGAAQSRIGKRVKIEGNICSRRVGKRFEKVIVIGRKNGFIKAEL